MVTDTNAERARALIAAARPRAIAALVRVFRNIDLAEDLFQEACVRALTHWQRQGMPDDPLAWLIRVGRNAGIDHLRRQARVASQPATEILDARLPEGDPELEFAEVMDAAHYKDDVLRLLFMCCHDDLSQTDQMALALKVVVGFSVPEIARAFVVTPKTMEQRITRAKKRAARVGTTLDTPSMAERALRLEAVIRMIYLLFNEGYSAGEGDAHIRLSLCTEAIRLARLLLELFPGQAPVMGLLALCLLQHSRHAARVSQDGRPLTLAEQDRALWNRDLIGEGLVLVERALRKGQPDSLQVQAAIAAVHCRAETADDTDWAEIDRLYGVLELFEPTPVVRLNHAVARAQVDGPSAGIEMLESLTENLMHYRPFHATRAALFEEEGAFGEALNAYRSALDCPGSDAEKKYISKKISMLKKKIN